MKIYHDLECGGEEMKTLHLNCDNFESMITLDWKIYLHSIFLTIVTIAINSKQAEMIYCFRILNFENFPNFQTRLF